MAADPHRHVRAHLPALLPRLWRFALVLSSRRPVAADLVQATCLRALERAEQFRPGTRLDRWTFSIMASIWKNQLRADAVRQGAGQVDAAEVLTLDAVPQVEATILLRQVLSAVGSLPELQRSALLLVYVEGWSYVEAATALEIPLGTLMSRLAAAKKSLAHLKTAGEDAAGQARERDR